MLRRLALALALISAPPAFAQTSALRATIDSISADGSSLAVHARSGEAATVRLKPETAFTLVVRAPFADVKPGAYVGVAAVPAADGALQALEVHIFPETMRGAGEGTRPFDLAPGSTMTNGALKARVEGVQGTMLTVEYGGGSQTIRIAPNTPIVAFAPGSREDLKPGAAIIARGAPGAGGEFEAARVLVGKDGLVPPM